MIDMKRWIVELIFAIVVTAGFFGGAYMVNHRTGAEQTDSLSGDAAHTDTQTGNTAPVASPLAEDTLLTVTSPAKTQPSDNEPLVTTATNTSEPVTFPADAPTPATVITPSPTPVNHGAHLENVVYDTETNCVTGKVSGAEDPAAYRVIVFIQPTESDRDLYVKPSESGALRPLKADDGTFNVEAFTKGDPHAPRDKAAIYYYVFLMTANEKYSDISNYAKSEGIPLSNAARDNAVDFVWKRETGNLTAN